MHAFIRDSVAGNQRLPLAKVVDALVEGLGLVDDSIVTVVLAEGYGAQVNALDDATEGGEPVSVRLSEISKVLHDESQWFYNLHVVTVGRRAAFGVLDSTSIFVEGAHGLVTAIAGMFDQVDCYEASRFLEE